MGRLTSVDSSGLDRGEDEAAGSHSFDQATSPAPIEPSSLYAFGNEWGQARERLSALAGWLDPGTRHILEARGVDVGWSCLEVGGGGGSIAAWLCEQVGPQGRVVATDIDPRFLRELDQPNLEVWRHDIFTDELPEEAFDLVHTRLVLAHLSEPRIALRPMLAALNRGGWLVAEELDFVTLVPVSTSAEANALFSRLMDAHVRVLEARGFDAFYGRGLSGHLEAQGLVEVEAEGSTSIWHGRSIMADVLHLTFLQLREALMSTAGITAQDLTDLDALLADPEFAFMAQLRVAAWGRRSV